MMIQQVYLPSFLTATRLNLNILKRIPIRRQSPVNNTTTRIQPRIHTRDPHALGERTSTLDLVLSNTQVIMRDPNSGLDSAGRRMLERALNELLAGLRLDVGELVVDFVEEVASG